MKKIIAHRGLMDGPDKDLENKPKQIIKALQEGFDCEIDLWNVKKDGANNLFLGHDGPVYPIDAEFLKKDGLWIHCKNFDALSYLQNKFLKQCDYFWYNFFWHQEDDYTLTSFGYIWVYPGKLLNDNSIAVLPERSEIYEKMALESDCYGICTDYANKWKNNLL